MAIIWVAPLIIFIWLAAITYFLIRIHRRFKSPTALFPVAGLRFSLVRFNPFSDTGGEQSFVLSLLDGVGNGILLTSLHGRGMTRIYAKKVTAGKADQELSAEEKSALSQALNQ